MAKRRYGIVLDEDVYRSWRTEAVGVGMSMGQWLTSRLGVPMDDIAKKAIEPDKIKVDTEGKLSKGLGEVPGRMTPKEMQAQKDLILRKISKGEK